MLKSAIAATAVLLSGATVAAAAPASAAPTASPAPQAAAVQCQRTLSTYPVLTIGARGPAVRTLQCLINDWGVRRVVVDGIYGPRTAQALEAMERSRRSEDPALQPRRVDAVGWTAMLARRIPARELRRGARGQAVVDLQRALRAAGAKITVDGVYGSYTEAVVRVYQRDWRLPVTGRVDRGTRQVLQGGGVFL